MLTNCVQPQHHVQGIVIEKLVPLAVTEDIVIKEAEVNRSELIAFAKTYLGTTYRYGGFEPTKGFDCSGFVYFVFKHFNIKLPRSSMEYKFYGTTQIPEEFKVGDVLVFYGYQESEQIGHIGIIYEANGLKSKFIHASSGKANGITISQLDSGQYAKRFYKCIDVISAKNGL